MKLRMNIYIRKRIDVPTSNGTISITKETESMDTVPYMVMEIELPEKVSRLIDILSETPR